MATLDDLPADQQAVLRLLLTQDRSYDEIARSLRMAPAGVRDRAREALARLGPADTPVDDATREQITDYLLGQQDEDAAAVTRETLEGSAAARGWARTVAGELAPMANGSLPEVPGAEGAVATRDALTDDDEAGARSARRAARERGVERPSNRRAGRILLAVLGVVALLGAGFALGRLTGRGGDGETTTTAAQDAAQGKVVGQANLTPPQGAPDKDALGVAQFIERDGQTLINVLAEGLPTAPKGTGYGVWLLGDGQQPKWLGYFQAVTTTGQVGAQSRIDVDPADYQTVQLSRQEGRTPKTPGTTYLRGPIQLGANGRGQQGG